MDGAADVAETTYVPFESKSDATPVRLIVRRVKPTPGAASPYIFPKAGPGKTSSAEPWPDCAPCHLQPDGVRPVRRTTEPPRRSASAGP